MFGVGTATFLTMGELKDDLAEELFDIREYDELTGAQRRILEQHPRFVDKERELDNKAGATFREQIDEADRVRLVSQRAFFARLSSGQLTRQQFADAIGQSQLISSVKRTQAAQDFGVEGSEPESPMAMALNKW